MDGRSTVTGWRAPAVETAGQPVAEVAAHEQRHERAEVLARVQVRPRALGRHELGEADGAGPAQAAAQLQHAVGGRHDVHGRRQLGVHGERQEHLGAAEHPLDVRVAGDALVRVGHGRDQHVHHDHHGQDHERGVQPGAHGLREVVVVGHRLLGADVRQRGLDDHRARGGRRHAEQAPEQRLERGVHAHERVVLLALAAGARVHARHARVVLVQRAQARGERQQHDAEQQGEPREVRGHLAQGHLLRDTQRTAGHDLIYGLGWRRIRFYRLDKCRTRIGRWCVVFSDGKQKRIPV